MAAYNSLMQGVDSGRLFVAQLHACFTRNGVALPTKVLISVFVKVTSKWWPREQLKRVLVQDRYPSSRNPLHPRLEPSLWYEKSSACEAVACRASIWTCLQSIYWQRIRNLGWCLSVSSPIHLESLGFEVRSNSSHIAYFMHHNGHGLIAKLVISSCACKSFLTCYP